MAFEDMTTYKKFFREHPIVARNSYIPQHLCLRSSQPFEEQTVNKKTFGWVYSQRTISTKPEEVALREVIPFESGTTYKKFFPEHRYDCKPQDAHESRSTTQNLKPKATYDDTTACKNDLTKPEGDISRNSPYTFMSSCGSSDVIIIRKRGCWC